MRRKFDQFFDRSDSLFLRRLMGMDPDSAVDFLISLGDFPDLVELADAGRDSDHPADPCPLRPSHDLVPFLGEVRKSRWQ